MGGGGVKVYLDFDREGVWEWGEKRGELMINLDLLPLKTNQSINQSEIIWFLHHKSQAALSDTGAGNDDK